MFQRIIIECQISTEQPFHNKRVISIIRITEKLLDIDIDCVMVTSLPQDLKQAKRSGFIVTSCENNPLGKKWNTGSLKCRETSPDYVLMMGSDDIMDDTLFAEYVKIMKKGIDFTLSPRSEIKENAPI